MAWIDKGDNGRTDDTYTTSDWQDEVAHRDTLLGYEEWVEHKRAANGEDGEDS